MLRSERPLTKYKVDLVFFYLLKTIHDSSIISMSILKRSKNSANLDQAELEKLSAPNIFAHHYAYFLSIIYIFKTHLSKKRKEYLNTNKIRKKWILWYKK